MTRAEVVDAIVAWLNVNGYFSSAEQMREATDAIETIVVHDQYPESLRNV